MGSALVSVLDNIESPTVGLLNIGEEDIKGNEIIKKTASALPDMAEDISTTVQLNSKRITTITQQNWQFLGLSPCCIIARSCFFIGVLCMAMGFAAIASTSMACGGL
jgi:hypothetical protein